MPQESLFTICAGIDPVAGDGVSGVRQFHRAVANWDTFELPQLLIGECGMNNTRNRQVLAEIRTNSYDQASFGDLWRQPDLEINTPWLLLAASDLLFTEDAIHNLCQALRQLPPTTLIVGRAWRVPELCLGLDASPSSVMNCLDPDGFLDAIGLWSWALVPSTSRFAIPDALGCSLEHVAPELISIAHALGWSVLDGSPAMPVVRPDAPPRRLQARLDTLESGPATISTPHPTQVVVPHQPGAPLLSFLLVAGEDDLDALSARLCPLKSLPWDVIARSVEPTDTSHAVVTAWSSAFVASTGQLIWPVVGLTPPLSLVVSVLRCFDTPGIDQVVLPAFGSSASLPSASADMFPPPPLKHTLVMHRHWLDRLGGFPSGLGPVDALLQLRRHAERRGALTHPLPLLCRWSAA